MPEPLNIIAAELPAVPVSQRAARRIADGFLWVYANEIEAWDPSLPPVAWCRFVRSGNTLATGYYNRHSLIAGRVAARGAVADLKRLLTERLRQAFLCRHPLPAGGAARLVFSEADRLPGLVVDLFPPFAVVQSGTAGMDLVLADIEALLPGIYRDVFAAELEGLVVRCDAGVRRLEAVEAFTRVVFGEPRALSRAAVTEHGVRYCADLIGGQKTGFFLDQRENRLRLGALVRDRRPARVLDLFCYSGGWGLRALHEGAGHVTFVDSSRDALDRLEEGLAANGIPPARFEILQSDVFDLLAGHAERYEVVVADPPAFVKSRKTMARAAKAYLKLNRLAWRRVAAGGLLFTCSCSHHLPEGEFIGLLTAAVAREGDLAQVLYRGFQAADHPALLSMPETAYLKCLGLLKVAPG
jgi:23S rRNA (cytosine1962-C5)-methyltransferase